jgi:hypothetical protein
VSGVPSARRRQVVALVVTACCIEALYWFVVTAGHVWRLPHYYVTFLDDLAEGFRRGHLHMALEPPAALLRKANPWSPENRGLWYWDASLFDGHYYLYWGPVPALLLAAAKTLLRIRAVIYDEVVVFGLASVQLAAGTWIVGRAARSFFDDPPLPLQVTAVVVIGLANPTPYNLARGAVYEAAIVGGQAFLLLGIACAAEWLARGARRWGVAAGAAWALALGCRVSLAPAVALMALATAVAAAGREGRAGERLRRLARSALPLALPLAAGLFALLLYNRLRFDAWLEFGRRYQLTWIAAPTSLRYLWPSLYSFSLRPPALSCRFPFLFAIPDMGARAFPAWFRLPPGYFVYEQVAGVLLACPWSWLTLVPLADLPRGLRDARARPARAWATAVAAIAALVGLLPAMTIASATNRYLGDAVGGIALWGAFGAFRLRERLRAHAAARRAAMAGVLALGILSAWFGLALGFFGQYVHFPANNPALADKLVHALSVCGDKLPPPPK